MMAVGMNASFVRVVACLLAGVSASPSLAHASIRVEPAEASTSFVGGLSEVAFQARYYARQKLFGLGPKSPADPTGPTDPQPPAEPDDPTDLLRCGVPNQGSMPVGGFNYAERGSSWLLENGPSICGRKPDTTGTQCLAMRNKSVSPWTFYVVYGSNPQIMATDTYGRATSSCSYGPGKKIAELVPEPPKVKCGGFTRFLRLGDYGDINDGGYAANLDEARARCNAVATPTKGYCVAYRNEGSSAPYIILIGGDHPPGPSYGGTEGWVARCE